MDCDKLLTQNWQTAKRVRETSSKPKEKQKHHKACDRDTEKFVIELSRLWNENNLEKLLMRVEKGTAYYKAHLTNLLKLLLAHIRETQQRKRVKTYLAHLTELDQMLSKKLEEFDYNWCWPAEKNLYS